MSEPVIRFCPQCAAAVRLEMRYGRLRPVCPECGWIHFSDPKVAAGVVVCLEGKVLLIRRNNEPQAGLWSIPAGFIDAHEIPTCAAERECLEETGLEVRCTDLMQVFGGREHPRGADILIVYRAEIVGGRLQAGDDAGQVCFYSLDDLPPLAFQSTKEILRQMQPGGADTA